MRSTTVLLGLLASCSASELIFKTADGTGAVAIAKLVGVNLEIASPSGGCTMLDGRCVASAISKLQSDLELVKAVASKALALAEQLQTEAAAAVGCFGPGGALLNCHDAAATSMPCGCFG